MRNIILNVAVSLDGFIEGPHGEFDWCFTDQDYGMTGFLEQIDSILFGRKSYELMKGYEPLPYPGKRKYVVSTTLTAADPEVTLIADNVVQTVRQLKNEPGKDIWLFGGAVLATTLLKANLIDELQLSVHPVLLGKGKPLFEEFSERIHWQLTDTKTYAGGLVQLHYRTG